MKPLQHRARWRWFWLSACGLAAPLCGAANLGAPGAPQQPAEVVVINPDLAGLQAVPGGGLLAWGSDASLWRYDAATATPFGTAVWRPASTGHDGRVRATAGAGDAAAPVVLAVGDGGLLLRSADGGQRWQPGVVLPPTAQAPEAAHKSPAGQRLDPSADLAALACEAQRCIAVGPETRTLLSDDAGLRWQPDASAPAAPLTGVAVAPAGGAAAAARWWLASADGRVWQGAPGAWVERPLGPPRAGAAPPAAIDHLAADAEGALLALADGRLLHLPAAGGPARLLHRSARGSYTRLAPLPGRGAWVATGSAGACAYRGAATAAGAAARPWAPCNPGRQRLLRGLASAPDGRTWVLVGEGGLLMHSRGAGRPWQAVRLPVLDSRPDLEAVLWSEARAGFVAVGPGGLVLHGSADGRRWTVAHSAPRHYVHDVVAPRGGGLLAAASYRTLARSDDGGRHWRSHVFTQLQEPAFLFALHADAQRGSVVVAGGQGSVMVAPDGEHWRAHSSGHGRDHLGLLAHPQAPLALLYGTGGQLLRVHTEAGAWHAVALPTADPLYGGFHAAAPGGGPSHPWLLGGQGSADAPPGAEPGQGVVLRGSPDGQHWQLQRVGMAVLRTGGPTPDGRALVVAGDRGAVYRATWPADAASAMALDPSKTGSATTLSEHAPRATPAVPAVPAALDWQPVPAPAANWAWLQTDAAGQALWLGGSGGALARSTDGGLSFQAVALPTQAALRRPTWDARRRAWWMPGRDGTLLRSDDDGRSWHAVFTHTREHLKGVWVDPRSGALLLYGARLVHLQPGPAASRAQAQREPPSWAQPLQPLPQPAPASTPAAEGAT